MSDYMQRIVHEAAVAERRDQARKHQLRQAIGCAFDEVEFAEMSAADFAGKTLQKLGLVGQNGRPMPKDPVTALESYLIGRQQARDAAQGRRGAMDGSGDSFVDHYLNGK